MFKVFQKKLKEKLEFWAVYATHKFFGMLSLKRASDAGGWLARTLGPHYKITKIAQRNLRRVFPHDSPQKIDAIIRGMWDNFGRVTGEYAHLDALYSPENIQVIGIEHVHALRDDGKPGLFFAGHIANWEVAATTIIQQGVSLSQVYRAANNQAVNTMIRAAQRHSTQHLIPKGPTAGRETLKVLQAGGHMMLMVDQKMDNGIPVPFFGIEAMTAPAIAKLALKFDCPLVPVRVERLQGVRFKVTFFPPLDLNAIKGSSQNPVFDVMTIIHTFLEDWIRDRPDLWLWVHRRWP